MRVLTLVGLLIAISYGQEQYRPPALPVRAASGAPQACAAPSVQIFPGSIRKRPGSVVTLTAYVWGEGPYETEWFLGPANDTSRSLGTGSLTYNAEISSGSTELTTDPIWNSTPFWVRVKGACGTASSGAVTISMPPTGSSAPFVVSRIAGMNYNYTNDDSYTGDGGPALKAIFNNIRGVARDSQNNLYLVEAVNRVRKVSAGAPPIAATIMGTGKSENDGDNGPALKAGIQVPSGIAVAPDGSIYVSSYTGHVIRRIDSRGVVTTIAGNGRAGSSGDNGQASLAQVSSPTGMACDTAGNLYFIDSDGKLIRRIAPNGLMTRIAGTGQFLRGAADGPVASTAIEATALAFNNSGQLYFAEKWASRVRTLSGGNIETVLGKKSAASTEIRITDVPEPGALAIAPGGVMFVSDRTRGILRIAPDGSVQQITSANGGWMSGNIPAYRFTIDPTSMIIDGNGDLIAADAFTIWRIDRKTARPGITVITHGFQLFGSMGDIRDTWMYEMGRAILRRAGSGSMWVFRVGSDDLEEITPIDLQSGAGGFRYSKNDPYQINGETVVLVDWAAASGVSAAGFAEATGHALAALLQGGIVRAGSGETIPPLWNQWTEPPLHFIGHSFGTVVNSQVIRRIGIPVDHVTMLDPHDWDQPYLAVDGATLTPDVYFWGNVFFADTYYNTRGGDSWNPYGRPLAGSIPGNGGMDLSGYEGFWNGESYNPHARVHAFYHGTIDPESIGTNVNGVWIDASWYRNSEDKTTGYNFARWGKRTDSFDVDEDCRIPGDGAQQMKYIPINCRSTRENDDFAGAGPGAGDVTVQPRPSGFFGGSLNGQQMTLEGWHPFQLEKTGAGVPGFKFGEWDITSKDDRQWIEVKPENGASIESHLNRVPGWQPELRFLLSATVDSEVTNCSLTTLAGGEILGDPIPIQQSTDGAVELVRTLPDRLKNLGTTIRFDFSACGGNSRIRIGGIHFNDER